TQFNTACNSFKNLGILIGYILGAMANIFGYHIIFFASLFFLGACAENVTKVESFADTISSITDRSSGRTLGVTSLFGLLWKLVSNSPPFLLLRLLFNVIPAVYRTLSRMGGSVALLPAEYQAQAMANQLGETFNPGGSIVLGSARNWLSEFLNRLNLGGSLVLAPLYG
ncbi:hypothetical protein QYM36_016066, partial [Artemia franciscana]